MEVSEYLRFVIALAFVLAMIALLTYVAKRAGWGYRIPQRNAKRRLGISEMIPLDSRRRLVLIKRDETEHLLLIGGVTDLVIENNIVPPAASAPVTTRELPSPAEGEQP